MFSLIASNSSKLGFIFSKLIKGVVVIFCSAKELKGIKKILKLNKSYFQVSYFFLISFFLILNGLKLLLVPV